MRFFGMNGKNLNLPLVLRFQVIKFEIVVTIWDYVELMRNEYYV